MGNRLKDTVCNETNLKCVKRESLQRINCNVIVPRSNHFGKNAKIETNTTRTNKFLQAVTETERIKQYN